MQTPIQIAFEKQNTMSKFASPRKSLGQNFLQDDNIIRKIVASLNIQTDDTVIEIGPGRGALTELIIQQAQQTHLIEFDRDLADYWRTRAEQNEALFVHEADVLKFDLSPLYKKDSALKVIGNLPYNISSPVLFHLMRSADHIHSQVVMLQKEVVERMAATPGNKQFGRLSVMLQYRYQIENLFAVSRHAFFPPPKVESAIAKLTPHTEINEPADSIDDLELVVKHAFAQRRKTLRNTLKPVISGEQIEAVGINPGDRSENLPVSDFVKLANIYTRSNQRG